MHNFTESIKQPDFGRTWRLLWPFVRAYRVQISVALVSIFVAAGAVLVFGWGLKQLIDQGFADASGAYLDRALLVLFLVIVFVALSAYARFYAVHWIAERATAELRRKIFAKLLSLDPAWYEGSKSGEDVSRINTDTTVLQMVVATNLPIALRHAVTMLGGIVMLFVVSAKMTLLVMLVVPLVVGPIAFFARKVRARSRAAQDRVGDISAFSHEALLGMQTIQSFGYEARAGEKFSGFVERTFEASMYYVRTRAFLIAYVISMVFTALGVVMWVGGHAVIQGTMTAGSLSAFVFYSVIVSGAVMSVSEAFSAFAQAAGAADRIMALLSAEPAVRGSAALPQPENGAVRFEGVTFSYPTRPGAHSLDGVSFAVEPGQAVALVGPSGAGKTTIFQLLQRFYDPQGGRVLVDGHDIRAHDPADVRRRLTVVSQDPAVFSVSVAENIRIGRPEATDEEVRHAAELAQAHEFIAALPQGYDTEVGERGSRLSGGQKQRIAIARAILKDAKILLLDEATSALDSHNELAVHMALRNLMKGRTTLIIAHRLSTVQNADRIIVLDKGRIVAEGTHTELYGSDKLYTHLAGLQLEVKAG